MIQTGLDKSFVLIATTVLLQPSRNDYDRYIKLIDDPQPFGFSGCYSGFDEQSLALLYQDKWHYISQQYNIIPWHENAWLPRGEKAAIYHFFGDTKPWLMDSQKWPDLTLWYKFYNLGVSYVLPL
jgi:lipopolysaccharide biosynthesis glycosyltransferase